LLTSLLVINDDDDGVLRDNIILYIFYYNIGTWYTAQLLKTYILNVIYSLQRDPAARHTIRFVILYRINNIICFNEIFVYFSRLPVSLEMPTERESGKGFATKFQIVRVHLLQLLDLQNRGLTLRAINRGIVHTH